MEITKNSRRQIAVLIVMSFMALLGCSNVAIGQENVLASSKSFDNDESIQYKLVFKLGVIRGKVGEAILTNKKINSGQQYFSQLVFRTTGVGDAFYTLRDTFETLYSSNRKPLRFEKRVNDKGYMVVDEVSFNHSSNLVRASVKSTANNSVSVDTVYTYNPKEVEVIDLLSSLALVRALDLSNPSSFNGKKVMIPIGRSQALTTCKYAGTEQVKGPNGKKTDSVIVTLNIRDEAFASQNNSVTVWVSNDESKIPLKLMANLKVGKVAVEITSYHNKTSSK